MTKKRGRPNTSGKTGGGPKSNVTPKMKRTVLAKVKKMCKAHPNGVTSTEVASELTHGNAQVFYSLKALAADGKLIEQRGARKDMNSNSMCFRPTGTALEL